MGSCTDPIGHEPALVALAWHPASYKPDAEMTVLLWISDTPFGGGDWAAGWWDGSDWRLCESGGICVGEVTHWAEPDGPGQQTHTDDVTDAARDALAARDRYGWSVEADKALERLRSAVGA